MVPTSLGSITAYLGFGVFGILIPERTLRSKETPYVFESKGYFERF